VRTWAPASTRDIRTTIGDSVSRIKHSGLAAHITAPALDGAPVVPWAACRRGRS
jgi:hypothetical protein